MAAGKILVFAHCMPCNIWKISWLPYGPVQHTVGVIAANMLVLARIGNGLTLAGKLGLAHSILQTL